MKAQCCWDSIGWQHSMEKSNTGDTLFSVLTGNGSWCLQPLSHAWAPSAEKANWQRPQLYQTPSSRGAWQSRGCACFLALFHYSARVTEGLCSLSSLGNEQWNSSPAFQYLSDSVHPRWALRPIQVHPRAPGVKPSWTRVLPAAWQHFLQLQSSLEQRQTPGQPGNRNKLCE